MSRLIKKTDVISLGQTHVYIPAKTAGARLMLGFHGAGALAETETDRNSIAGAARAEAFYQAGFAQLWINGGKVGSRTVGALTTGATAMTTTTSLEPGVYTIDTGPLAENVTVTSTGTAVTMSALVRGHAANALVMSMQLTGWASDADIDMMNQSWAWAKTNLPVKTDKVITYGNSAGNAWALAWANANPGIILGHAGTFPVVDIKDCHDNDRGSLRISIQQAWNNGTRGTAPPDSWFSARAPISLQGSATLQNLPQKLWISSDDPVAVSAPAYSYASAVGATTVSLGAAGHAFSQPAPYGAVPHADVATYLASFN